MWLLFTQTDRPNVIASTSGGMVLSIEDSGLKPSASNQPHWKTATRLP